MNLLCDFQIHGYRPQVPRATVAVDVDGDGRPDYLVSGVDRDRDGIPDVMQQVLICFIAIVRYCWSVAARRSTPAVQSACTSIVL